MTVVVQQLSRLIKQQWFVKMEELAKPAINALKTGELQFRAGAF